MAKSPDTIFLSYHRPRPESGDATARETMLADVLNRALADALAKSSSAVSGRFGKSPEELETLAAAFAEVMAGRSAIVHLPPQLSGPATRVFLEKVARVGGTLDANHQEAAIERLAEIVLPDRLAAVRGTLAADNLDLRDRFVAETRPLTSATVAAQAGFTGKNRYATAARWKRAGAVFSVQHRGTEYFPAFQFRDGRPHPTVGETLAALPERLSPWQRAFWFVSTNGWLGDRAPANLLDDRDAVVAAAAHEREEVIG
jgi:hypothetical protein